MASKLHMAIILALAGAGITIGLISAQERHAKSYSFPIVIFPLLLQWEVGF